MAGKKKALKVRGTIARPEIASDRDGTPGHLTYTYLVNVSFDLQYSFTADEVEQAEEGNEGDRDPTEEALAALTEEIREHLQERYSVDKIEAWADFDSLLGIHPDPAMGVASSRSAQVDHRPIRRRRQTRASKRT